MTAPDYRNSILSISNSILKYYGATPFHETLSVLDEKLKKKYRNVILLVMDGMGSHVLESNLPADSFFRRNTVATLSSVFPTTTVAALTSIQSGLAPNEHGWLGWSCYFKEIDQCVDLFSNNISGVSGGVRGAEEHFANKYMGFETILSKISRANNNMLQTYEVWPFANSFADTFDKICGGIRSLCQKDGDKFIYAYHFQPDHDLHDFGVKNDHISSMLRDFDGAAERLCAELENTLLIVTADHGHIDMIRRPIEDYPVIHQCLRRGITLESRCCGFFIKDEYMDIFPDLFKAEFRDKFVLYTHDAFLNSGLLGGGRRHEKTDDFVGDYVAVAVSGLALWNRDDRGAFDEYRSSHAGLTTEELGVPLILIET